MCALARRYGVLTEDSAAQGILWTWVITSFPADTTHRGALVDACLADCGAFALAFVNMISYACGDLPGSFVYPSKFGPGYRESHAITLVALLVTVVFVLLLVRLCGNHF